MVNSTQYIAVLESFMVHVTYKILEGSKKIVFQDGRATTHIAQNNIACTKYVFLVRHLRFGNVEWPVHSPDLSVSNVFLLGNLKERVYRERFTTLMELKETIVAESV